MAAGKPITVSFSSIEMEQLLEQCPANSSVTAQITEINGQYLAEISIRFQSGAFSARSRCPSLYLAKRHCMASIDEQIRQWRATRFLDNSPPIAKSPPKILIIDDDPITARVAASIFRQVECHVKIVNSAEDAIAEINRGRYDLILLDWFLGEMNGGDVLAKAHANFQGKVGATLPVVIWSGQISSVKEISFQDHFRILERWDKIISPEQMIKRTTSIVRDLDLRH